MMTSELEEIIVVREAICLTAKRLKIDIALKSAEDLLLEIDGRHREICDLLREFIHAYVDWYRFHRRNDELGKCPPYNANDRELLTRLVGKRRNEDVRPES